jgi:hypothetical protein
VIFVALPLDYGTFYIIGGFILDDLGGRAFVVELCFNPGNPAVGDFPMLILGPLGPSSALRLIGR